MQLLVDVGNSRIKWTDRDRLLKGNTSIDYTSNLQSLLDSQWSHLQQPDSVWISSVTSKQVLNKLISWSIDNWNINPSCAKTYHQQLGVVNGYENPVQLGVDRWMSLIGARDLFNRTIIVVDCGTATTIDALNQDGQHMGGIILPGLHVMRESLLGNTAIPETRRSYVKSYFAQDTATAIESGAVLSTVCLIERVAEILRKKIGGEVICVLTGGGADDLKDSLDMNFYHEPNLVLLGLALIAKANDI